MIGSPLERQNSWKSGFNQNASACGQSQQIGMSGPGTLFAPLRHRAELRKLPSYLDLVFFRYLQLRYLSTSYVTSPCDLGACKTVPDVPQKAAYGWNSIRMAIPRAFKTQKTLGARMRQGPSDENFLKWASILRTLRLKFSTDPWGARDVHWWIGLPLRLGSNFPYRKTGKWCNLELSIHGFPCFISACNLSTPIFTVVLINALANCKRIPVELHFTFTGLP